MKQIEYKVGEDIMSLIQQQIYEVYQTKGTSFMGPNSDVEFFVETGIAGMREVDKAIKQMVITSGLVINAAELGAITGKKNEGKYFTSYHAPFLGTVHFSLNKELDPKNTEYLNGYAKSSYTYRLLAAEDSPKIVTEIVATGVLPIFEDELRKLIEEAQLDKKYEVSSRFLAKYIQKCLKTYSND